MDVEAWADWLLVERDLRPGYVANLRRRVAGLARAGLDWGMFRSGPGAARDAVRPILAAARRRGCISMVRECEKALNLLADWFAVQDPDWLGVRWVLAKEPRRRLEPYTPAEVRRLAGGVGAGFAGARRAAMVWVLANTGLRRGEVWSLRVEDLDQLRSAALLRSALKDGRPRWVLLPRSGWAAQAPLGRWLTVRGSCAMSWGPLWVSVYGRPLTLPGFAGDLHRVRVASGVAGNFNRFRHTRGTIFEETGTPLEVAQRALGHVDPKNTMHYMHGSLERQRAVLARCGVPGYEGEPEAVSPATAWAGLGCA